MKRILTIVLLLFVEIGFCQEVQIVDTNYFFISPYELADSVLSKLDLSGVSSGILLDKGLSTASKIGFDTNANTDTLKDFQIFGSIYNVLLNATIDSTKGPNPNKSLQDTIISDIDDGLVPILSLNFVYESFLEDSVNLYSLITWDGTFFHDVLNRTNEPFESHEIAVSASPRWEFLNSLTQSFVIRPNYFQNNTGKNIDVVEIDFGNGNGLVNVNFNEPINILWPSYGIYTVNVVVTYSDNSSYSTFFNVSLKQKVSNIAVNGYDLSLIDTIRVLSNTGLNYGLNLQIAYACGHDRLIKPLIYVEGFNPSEFSDDPRGNSILTFFRRIIDYKAFNLSGQEYFDLETLLNEEGYDLVYVDFDNGAGDLKENAYALQEAINWINQEKYYNGSDFQNIIIGESMGGVISRLALRYMEIANISHDCKYYLSFDSPHLGANIPLGFQIFLERMSLMLDQVDWLNHNIRTAKSQFDNAISVLEKPGAKQLLIYNRRGNLYNVIDQSYLDLQSELNSLGMPLMTVKNIGIANGSGSSHSQGYSTLYKLMDMDVNSFNALSLYNPDLNIFWSAFVGGLASFLGTSFDIEAEVYSLPAYSNQSFKIYKDKGYVKLLSVPTPVQNKFWGHKKRSVALKAVF